jgi:hypothetical protein
MLPTALMPGEQGSPLLPIKLQTSSFVLEILKICFLGEVLWMNDDPDHQD